MIIEIYQIMNTELFNCWEIIRFAIFQCKYKHIQHIKICIYNNSIKICSLIRRSFEVN